MYKRLFLASLLLWLAVVVAAGVLFVRGTTAPGSDGRTAIRLSLSERDFVLGEMRTMLGAVQGVAEGIAANDLTAVSRAASGSGIAFERGVPVTLMGRLPLEFKQQGMAMHAGFDEIAAAAAKGESGQALTGRLAGQLNLCLGCHQSYRFDPVQ